MPEIPSFVAPLPGEIPENRARLDPNALAAPGLAAEQAGRATERFGTELGQLVEQHNQRQYNETLANLTDTAWNNLESGKEEVRQQGNWQGFAARQLQSFDDYAQQQREGAPSAIAERLDRRIAIERRRIMTNAAGFEHSTATEATLAGHQADIDRTGTGLYREPGRFTDEVARIGNAIDSSAASGWLNPLQQEKLKRGALDQLAVAAIRGRQAKGDAGLADDLEQGRYDAFLTPQSLERLGPVIDDLKGEQLGRRYSPLRGGAGSGPQPNASDDEIDKALAPVIQRESGGRPLIGWKETDLTGVPLTATGFPDWPGKPGPKGNSTAAGLYQITKTTWDPIARQLGITDFSPESQRAVARELYRQRGLQPWQTDGGPDLDNSIASIEGASGYTDKQKDKAIGVATRDYHHWHQATAQERAGLMDDMKNGITMLASGRDWTEDRDAVRRLLPPEKADEALRAIDEARQAGNIKNRVWFASPAELADQWRELQRRQDSGQDFARLQRYNEQYLKVVKARDEALDPKKGDPAAFVRGAPAVAEAWDKAQHPADPQNPAPEAEAAIRASLAEQERLGVPPENRRVLTKPQADAMVREMVTTDPGKADIVAALNGAEHSYGTAWPQVFGDLVRAGLPGEYQVLATMDTNGQAAPRAALQGVLKLIAEKGGVEHLRKSIPPDALQTIHDGIDAQLKSFRASISDVDLFDHVKSAVQNLAYYYAYQGIDPAIALQRAYNGVIARKYDLVDQPGIFGQVHTLRVPRSIGGGTASLAGDYILNGLKAGDLMDPNDYRLDMAAREARDERLSEAGRQQQREQIEAAATSGVAAGELGLLAQEGPTRNLEAITREIGQNAALTATRRGYWQTNEDETGMIRIGYWRDGARVPMRRANGDRLEIKFADIPSILGPAPTLSEAIGTAAAVSGGMGGP